MKQQHGALWLSSVLWLMSAGSAACAQDPLLAAPEPAVQTQIQLRDPIHKLGRGLVNVLTCWLEIPKQIHVGRQQGNPIFGVGQGLVQGVKWTGLRLGVGAYEAVTFPLPYYPRDFASPYEQMELSDYAWE